jgi:ATP/maltotriose-dependent transcriptional regulator MalT
MSNPELSERELAVLRSLAQGMSNADIAAALSIGEGTVKSHVNRILNKLDVSDRAQAVIVRASLILCDRIVTLSICTVKVLTRYRRRLESDLLH